ncbi:ATP-binding protein [Streptomyces werraensis]|uniref:ATP-binding protein n=1 Tax=Streptomyces werraensis TaxID=68284 RepID=UPI001CE33CA7
MSPTPLLTQPQHRFETLIAPELAKVSDVRRSAWAVLRRWDVDEPLAGDVQTVVSELVANAIEHGSGWVALKLAGSMGGITVEVSDASPVPARIRSSQPDDSRGRGLMIVAALAQSWGVSDNGFTTWAAFPGRQIRDYGD